MSKPSTSLWFHLAGAACASVLLAYTGMRLAEPASPVAPLDAGAGPDVRPDALLAGRQFGQVAAPAVSSFNLQALGAFVAGRASSAVISLDGRRQRAVLLGQEVAPGAVLAEVHQDHIVLAQGAAHQDYPLPVVDGAQGSAPNPQFTREGNTLTAPTVDGAGTVAPPRPAGLPGYGEAAPVAPAPPVMAPDLAAPAPAAGPNPGNSAVTPSALRRRPGAVGAH